MKNFILLLAILFSQIIYSQTKVSVNEKTESLIRIWGLMKYHHPVVSAGAFDWNEEFVKQYDKIEAIDNQAELNTEFLNWIRKFDSPKTKFKSDSKFLSKKNLFTKNADFRWIENSSFSPELTVLLDNLRKNSNISNYYASLNFTNYVQFKNEKGYDNFDSTLRSNRLLFLASFWNAMRYWNVNIYLTESPWSEVLTNAISNFMNADPIKYEIAKFDLTSQLRDSHALYDSKNDSYYPFSKRLNLNGRIINDSLVITQLLTPEITKRDSIGLGDVVVSVNGMTFKDYYKSHYSKVLNHSNNNFLKYVSANFNKMFSTNSDSLEIGIVRADGSSFRKYVQTYGYAADSNLSQKISAKKRNSWENLTDKIGYLNLAVLTPNELSAAFKSFKNTDGIVIDLRNYPLNINPNHLGRYLYPKKKVFLKVLSTFSPGYGEYDVKAKLRWIKNPFSAGRNNKKYYKGKVILLVNRATQSRAEWIGMAIQNSPNCTTLGEQTSGAVMNITTFKMVDESVIYFTSMGAFYPDDSGVQRKGLKIDYEIKESAIHYNPDLYIEEAIKIIGH